MADPDVVIPPQCYISEAQQAALDNIPGFECEEQDLGATPPTQQVRGSGNASSSSGMSMPCVTFSSPTVSEDATPPVTQAWSQSQQQQQEQQQAGEFVSGYEERSPAENSLPEDDAEEMASPSPPYLSPSMPARHTESADHNTQRTPEKLKVSQACLQQGFFSPQPQEQSNAPLEQEVQLPASKETPPASSPVETFSSPIASPALQSPSPLRVPPQPSHSADISPNEQQQGHEHSGVMVASQDRFIQATDTLPSDDDGDDNAQLEQHQQKQLEQHPQKQLEQHQQKQLEQRQQKQLEQRQEKQLEQRHQKQLEQQNQKQRSSTPLKTPRASFNNVVTNPTLVTAQDFVSAVCSQAAKSLPAPVARKRRSALSEEMPCKLSSLFPAGASADSKRVNNKQARRMTDIFSSIAGSASPSPEESYAKLCASLKKQGYRLSPFTD